MKRVATALAAAAALALMAAPAFSAPMTMAKPDIDGVLKQVLHGKPGWWMAEMKMPAPMAMPAMKMPAMKMNFPMLWPMPKAK